MAGLLQKSVYSNERSDIGIPSIASLPPDLAPLLDQRNQANGLEFLFRLPNETAPLVFFDRGGAGHAGRVRGAA